MQVAFSILFFYCFHCMGVAQTWRCKELTHDQQFFLTTTEDPFHAGHQIYGSSRIRIQNSGRVRRITSWQQMQGCIHTLTSTNSKLLSFDTNVMPLNVDAHLALCDCVISVCPLFWQSKVLPTIAVGNILEAQKLLHLFAEV